MKRPHWPTVPTAVLDRGIELGLSLALALTGVRALLTPGATPRSITDLGACLAVLFRLSCVIGGCMAVTGLLIALLVPVNVGTNAQIRDLSRRAAFGRTLEQAGLWLIVGPWVLYAFALGSRGTLTSTLIVGVLVAIAGGCVARICALRRKERETLALLKALNAAADKAEADTSGGTAHAVHGG